MWKHLRPMYMNIDAVSSDGLREQESVGAVRQVALQTHYRARIRSLVGRDADKASRLLLGCPEYLVRAHLVVRCAVYWEAAVVRDQTWSSFEFKCTRAIRPMKSFRCDQ